MKAENGGNGGVIINMSSLISLQEKTHSPVYRATKTAVLQFSNNIAVRYFMYKNFNIGKVNGV